MSCTWRSWSWCIRPFSSFYFVNFFLIFFSGLVNCWFRIACNLFYTELTDNDLEFPLDELNFVSHIINYVVRPVYFFLLKKYNHKAFLFVCFVENEKNECTLSQTFIALLLLLNLPCIYRILGLFNSPFWKVIEQEAHGAHRKTSSY